MFCALVALALLAEPIAPPVAVAPDPSRPKLVFAGNRVLSDDVYLAVLKLPADFRADADTAADVERRLTRFLRDAGYELSSVHAVAHDNQIDVGINEGRLEKIVWRGRLKVETLRFTFAIDIPHDVFNRPMIERQSAQLAKELGIERVWFVLVPTAALTHIGPQLEKLPAIQGIELLHEREPWELHFFFSESEWGTGFGLDLRSSYADGLELGGNYHGQNWLLADDRVQAAVMGGIGLRRRVENDQIYPAFSRAMAEGRWFSPKLITDLRPFLWVQGEYIARQRRDLKIEDYQVGTVTSSVNLQHEATPGLKLSVGLGIQWRTVRAITAGTNATVSPSTPWVIDDTVKAGVHETVRGFFALTGELVFDPGNNRADRRHVLFAEIIQYRATAGQDPWFGYAHYWYQQVVPIGWHDFWFKTRGRSLWNTVDFHNEDSAGEYTHGLFGDNFVRKGISATGEFRFSVTRDIFKLSFFHDVFAFGEINRTDGSETLRWGTSVGPGFHALIEGMFQLDIYGSFGVLFGPLPRSGSRLDAAVNLTLNKVF